MPDHCGRLHGYDPASDIRAWEKINNLPEARLRRVWAGEALTAADIRDAWVEVRTVLDEKSAVSNNVVLTPAEALSLWREGVIPDAEAGNLSLWRIRDNPAPDEVFTNLTVVLVRRVRSGSELHMDYLDEEVLYTSENTLRWLRDNLGLAPEKTPQVPAQPQPIPVG